MERPYKPRILVLITNPFAMINVIHSGLIGELGKRWHISILSNLLTESDIVHFNHHFCLNMELLKTPVPALSWFEKRVRSSQVLLFGHFFNLATFRIKLFERHRAVQWVFHTIRGSYLIRLFTGWLLLQTRGWLIRHTTRPDEYQALLRHNFRAVLSTSPLDLRENKIINSLKSCGIKCISMLISWDNLTSKGIINTNFDMVLVWNELMAAEYNRFYQMFGDIGCVCVTGVPRFDIYFKKMPFNAILTRLSGIDPDKRVILFATGAVKHHSCQNYIIDDLLEYGKEKRDILILVRCHPGDDPDRYRQYSCSKKLVFYQPFNMKSPVPPVDFLETLQLQLEACYVCVQVASTMFLDAAACNKPVISIAYDAHPGTPYISSVRRFYDYSHHFPLHKLLEGHIAYNKAELFVKLDEALKCPHTTGNSWETAKPIIHHCAPDSTHLTTQYIQVCLDR
ncbi:CDP-glycerol glycerophosphotransferase family protein [Dyadobacter sp. CY261]|uniref:CDP-glycerol glycerophosphotransferase family protein n=1 Tax=Dyadobacter sp. CY261 TaxID=2907203 RepID=UPI001F255E4B|nr:CDP-glycerol glycerophosphotransferase family protein [Dyadobacter sp. CY261]MCF0071410.1 CDP-glycerol glycerophosphotransferase family protein [Dyadobacter sp. CY261]